MKDVGHVFLSALAGDHILLSFVISDPTLLKEREIYPVFAIEWLIVRE